MVEEKNEAKLRLLELLVSPCEDKEYYLRFASDEWVWTFNKNERALRIVSKNGQRTYWLSYKSIMGMVESVVE